MYIKSIEWMYKEDKEAIVIISDGKFELSCFSHPFEGKTNEKVKKPIDAHDVENVVVAFEKTPYVEKKDHFKHFIRGLLYDIINQIVLVNDIEICLCGTDIAKDIKEGSFIEFDVGRFDL